jgi:hypothetical protein
VSAIKRENPEDERAEVSHPKKPVDAATPRGMSDELVEGETLDVGDDPKSKERKNSDGPFGESKEVIGGYLVRSRSKSGRGGAHRQRRPCLDHSKLVEIRPIDSGADTHGSWRNELASADNTSQ